MGALIGVLIVVGIIAAVVGGSADKKEEDAASATCAGYTYPDKQKRDRCAAANTQIEMAGLTVSAGNFRRQANAVFGPEICADVSYLNRSNETKDFNQFDWKLQPPSGAVQSFELTEATLGSGQLVTGGTKAGTVCFKDTGEKGQFLLIWKPEAFRSDRGVWLFSM